MQHSAYLEGLNESPQEDADRVALTQQLYESSGSEQSQKPKTDEVILQGKQTQILPTNVYKTYTDQCLTN